MHKGEKRARPDLPSHHPQNVPLDKWTDGWLKMSVAGHICPTYIMAHDCEKAAKGWPITRAAMIDFLVMKRDIPAAGIYALTQGGGDGR